MADKSVDPKRLYDLAVRQMEKAIREGNSTVAEKMFNTALKYENKLFA